MWLYPWRPNPGTPKPFCTALGKSGQALGSGSQATGSRPPTGNQEPRPPATLLLYGCPHPGLPLGRTQRQSPRAQPRTPGHTQPNSHLRQRSKQESATPKFVRCSGLWATGNLGAIFQRISSSASPETVSPADLRWGGLTNGFLRMESQFVHRPGVAWQLVQNPPGCGVPHVDKPTRESL